MVVEVGGGLNDGAGAFFGLAGVGEGGGILRVARLFGGSPGMTGLQAACDLGELEQREKVMEHIARVAPLNAVNGGQMGR